MVYPVNSTDFRNFRAMDSRGLIRDLRFGTLITLEFAMFVGACGLIGDILTQSVPNEYIITQSTCTFLIAGVGFYGVRNKIPILLFIFVIYCYLVILVATIALCIVLVAIVFNKNADDLAAENNTIDKVADAAALSFWLNILVFCGLTGVFLGAYFVATIPYRYVRVMLDDDYTSTDDDELSGLYPSSSVESFYNYNYGTLVTEQPMPSTSRYT